jgi:hypothetical protein
LFEAVVEFVDTERISFAVVGERVVPVRDR